MHAGSGNADNPNAVLDILSNLVQNHLLDMAPLTVFFKVSSRLFQNKLKNIWGHSYYYITIDLNKSDLKWKYRWNVSYYYKVNFKKIRIGFKNNSKLTIHIDCMLKNILNI